LQLLSLALSACSREDNEPAAGSIERIEALFQRKRPARAGDWLAEHRESGQTFAQYRAPPRQRVASLYSTLRIVPIGPLSAGQSDVVQTVADIMKPFFGLALSVDTQVPLKEIPADAQRVPYEGAAKQLLTTYLLQQVLTKYRTPTDAAVLGITAMDLWPGPGWNFVFGQGSLTERIGVWSMARNGDPDAGAEMHHLSVMRTLKTATHETGHMLGIKHCIAYECGMNGSNHSDERDRQPLEFCPECQPKLWWTLNLDPLARSTAVEAVSRRNGFDTVTRGFARQSAALRTRN